MKKLLITSLVATLALTACNKQDAPPPAENKAETAKPADAHADHDHKEGDHAHEHSHEGHDHAGHHHHDHEGEPYQCGDKAISIVVHNHEGEMEAHATIDDIEYDMPADTAKPNYYVAPEEGLNNQGMAMTIAGDKATFTSLDGKTTLLACQKAEHKH